MPNLLAAVLSVFAALIPPLVLASLAGSNVGLIVALVELAGVVVLLNEATAFGSERSSRVARRAPSG